MKEIRDKVRHFLKDISKRSSVMKFDNNDKANEYVMTNYRSGWTL